jgi:class 3 adenylate cyclase/tetratricopeptide (TPR) repeat protein
MAWTCGACSRENPDGTAFCGMCGAPRIAVAGPTVVAPDPMRGLIVVGGAESPRPDSGSLRSERRLVTALFADISGFSRLTDQVDAEQLVEIIDPVVTALSNVIGRYGGVVEKYAGDALLALFGAPVAHTDDAARALRAALELHAELRRLVPLLPAAGSDLSLHVGVNSGHGVGRVIGSEVRLDYAVLGDVVVLAQRLEAAAPTGETYVGRTTYELTRGEFRFEPLGELSVKGKSEAVPAWRLLGPRDAGAPAVDAAERQVVGRARELATMVEHASRIEKGGGGAIFVLGEPGLGKSALCEAMRAHSAEAGWEWLSARCLSYGSELAYWPVADLLRRLFGVDQIGARNALQLVRRELAEAGVEDTLPFLGVLCGVAGTPSTELGAQALQLRMHESVVAILRARAASRPVLLHLDDLQWADPPTVALVGEIAAATRSSPIMLLVAARPEAATTVNELDARLAEDGLRLVLQPLDAEAVAAIAARILDGPPDETLATSLLEHTRGNPFFVEEVARTLAERGELTRNGGGWTIARAWDDTDVPLTVEEVIAARIDMLGDEERHGLELLAVIGRRADLALARAIDERIDSRLRPLLAAGLLDRSDDASDHVSFHHPLTHHVVYARLLRRQRAKLHREVGEAAERLYGSDDSTADLLARHFYLGDDPVRAYEHLLRSAARAEQLFANDQAIDHLRRALELTEEATGSRAERSSLQLRQARLEETRGSYDEALSLYREVHEATGDVRAAVGLASTLRKLGRYDDSLEVVRTARASSPVLGAEDRAVLALEEGWVLGGIGDPRGAIAVLADGLAAVEGTASAVEGDLLVHLARTEELIWAIEDGLDHARRARELFESRGDLPRLATTLRILGGLLQDAAGEDRDAMQRAREMLEQAHALARRVGNAEEQGASLINLGQVLADLSLRDEALAADRQALAAFDSVGIKAGVACAYCNLAEHLQDAGDWEQSRAAALRGLAVGREIGHKFWISGALIGIAEAELELGNPAAAAAAAEDAIETATASDLTRRLESALKIAARAYAALGDEQRSEAAAARARLLEEPEV